MMALAGILGERAAADGIGSASPVGDDAFYQRMALDPQTARQQQVLARLMIGPSARGEEKRSVDLTRLAEMAIASVRGMGVPLIEHRDERGRGPIAVSAQFSVAGDSPDLRMHLSARALEPMGAFYPATKGIRFSVVYPMKNFSLRLDAGEDSEFGSIAVAGISWVHPSKRFAAGFGLHGGNLENSRSGVGAIFQFRMNLYGQE